MEAADLERLLAEEKVRAGRIASLVGVRLNDLAQPVPAAPRNTRQQAGADARQRVESIVRGHHISRWYDVKIGEERCLYLLTCSGRKRIIVTYKIVNDVDRHTGNTSYFSLVSAYTVSREYSFHPAKA